MIKNLKRSMKTFTFEEAQLYKKDFSVDDQSLYDYVNTLHCVKRVDFLSSKNVDLLPSIVRNSKTVMFFGQIHKIFTESFFTQFPSIEILSKTNGVEAIIVQYTAGSLTVVMERQEYQCLGLVGKLDKMTNRYC